MDEHLCPVCGCDVETPLRRPAVYERICQRCWTALPNDLRWKLAIGFAARMRNPVMHQESVAALLQYAADQKTANRPR